VGEYKGKSFCHKHLKDLSERMAPDLPVEGQCNYRKCQEAATRERFKSHWCARHYDTMVAIRDAIDPHKGTAEELDARLTELKVRRDADEGHKWFYLQCKIGTFAKVSLPQTHE
jgi:hypothetical protein